VESDGMEQVIEYFEKKFDQQCYRLLSSSAFSDLLNTKTNSGT